MNGGLGDDTDARRQDLVFVFSIQLINSDEHNKERMSFKQGNAVIK